jgi:protein-L-isoaspartate(D-aspartate) O-methyltransferase
MAAKAQIMGGGLHPATTGRPRDGLPSWVRVRDACGVKDRFAARRERMVEGERRSGVVLDEQVLRAMATVPREVFVPDHLRESAYEERALPIGSDQTISQPLVVAMMTSALELEPDDRVLEVGTGSGYQAAVLRRLVDHVVTVERLPELVEYASGVLAALGVDGVEVHCTDGTLGWPEGGPYDGIVVTAGGPRVPEPLVHQLADGGRLVMPVGPRGDERLVRVRKVGEHSTREDLGPVAFVPLVGREGWATATP